MIVFGVGVMLIRLLRKGSVMGFHALDWVIVLALVGLLILGPKALQSLGRSAGKGMGQAKAVKDKVMSELPIEEIAEVSRQIPRVPMNSRQAIEMLVTPERKSERAGERKEDRSK